MVHLKDRKNGFIIFIVIALIILFIYIIYFMDNDEPITPPEENEWNTSIDNERPSDFDVLYNLSEVPTLDKLLVNSTFIKQVTVNRVPYLHGFSSDGRFAAFIYYTDKNGEAFIVQIYDTLMTELVYSTYIPNTENLLESKELVLAQQSLSNGYVIDVMPDKLNFENQMEYETISSTYIFDFEVEKEDDSSFLKISKKDSKERWFIFFNSDLKYKRSNVQMFNHPGDADLVVFAVNNSQFNEQNFTPIFLDLKKLSYKNSEKGRTEEADNWLYGSFEFIYNQWSVNAKNGFIAVSINNKNIQSPKYTDFVEQWVYLDSSGRMKWYGNAKGIFNFEANPVQQLDRAFYYRVRIIEGINKKSLQSFTIDQYDIKTDEFIRTIEFEWDDERQSIETIQAIEPHLDESN